MNLINRLISVVSPKYAAKRHAYGMAARQLSKMLGGGQRSLYDSGKTGKRLSNWGFQRTGPNSVIERDNFRTRERSRDFARNNPYARRPLRVIPVSVVGTGIRPSFVHENSEAIDSIKKLWKKWASKTVCDFDGTKTFYGIQKMAMRAVLESGGVLIRKVVTSNPRNPIGLELQVIEIDHLDETKNGPLRNGGYIRKGIETNRRGKVVAYHILDHHPNDQDFRMSRVSKRYSAKNIRHIFDEERPGQKIGIAAGHASMVKLRDHDEYEEAQLIRQKIASCFAVFIEQAPAHLPAKAKPSGDDGYDIETVDPGMIQYLSPGENVKFGNPPVTEGYDSYNRRVLQGIAAGYDMTYEGLTGDLSNVNFSSGRMGWIEFGRFVEDRQQNMMIPMLCDPVFQWFQQMVILKMNDPQKGIDIRKVIMDTEVTWTPPHRQFIDPDKEVKAMVKQVRSGLMSWQTAVRRLGYDPDDIIKQLSEDKQKFDKNGLILEVDLEHEINQNKPQVTAPSVGSE